MVHQRRNNPVAFSGDPDSHYVGIARLAASFAGQSRTGSPVNVIRANPRNGRLGTVRKTYRKVSAQITFANLTQELVYIHRAALNKKANYRSWWPHNHIDIVGKFRHYCDLNMFSRTF
jgi:hypothetical protein